jgi:periplasmic copper chaperone A
MNFLRSTVASLALALAGMAAFAHEFKLGDITIGHPYSRTTAPGQSTGGAYLRLENRGAADKLVSASAPVAQGIEMHEMRMSGDMMQMREVGAIDLPSNKPVVLHPGGLHLMLVGLKAPLKKGDKFPLTLRFQNAGEVTVDVVVETPSAEPMKPGMKH